jgi:hypothetical protein
LPNPSVRHRRLRCHPAAGRQSPRPFKWCSLTIGHPIRPEQYPLRREPALAWRTMIDEVMFEIREITGQTYLDQYAGHRSGTSTEPGAVIEPPSVPNNNAAMSRWRYLTIQARSSPGATYRPGRLPATHSWPPSAAPTSAPTLGCGWPARPRRGVASAAISSKTEACRAPTPGCASTGSMAAVATPTTTPERATADSGGLNEAPQ